MSITDKISFLWNKALTDAMGAGHPAPFDYADAQVASLRAMLRAVERKQAHPNGHPVAGNKAGRRQAAERRGR